MEIQIKSEAEIESMRTKLGMMKRKLSYGSETISSSDEALNIPQVTDTGNMLSSKKWLFLMTFSNISVAGKKIREVTWQWFVLPQKINLDGFLAPRSE